MDYDKNPCDSGECLEENPDTTLLWIVGGVVAVGALWWLMKKKPAATTTPSLAPPPPPPVQQTTPAQAAPWQAAPAGQAEPQAAPIQTGACAVDQISLNSWAFAQGKAAFYLPTATMPISLSDLKTKFPVTSLATLPILIVTQNGAFYSFDNLGNPVFEPGLQTSYCQSKVFQYVPVNFS